jgi:hypothetical protein
VGFLIGLVLVLLQEELAPVMLGKVVVIPGDWEGRGEGLNSGEERFGADGDCIKDELHRDSEFDAMGGVGEEWKSEVAVFPGLTLLCVYSSGFPLCCF